MSRSRKKHPYSGSKKFDYSCRNHGSCDYCRENRLHANKRRDHSELEGQAHRDAPSTLT